MNLDVAICMERVASCMLLVIDTREISCTDISTARGNIHLLMAATTAESI